MEVAKRLLGIILSIMKGKREITPFSGELGKLNLGRFTSLQEAITMAKEKQRENLTRPAEIACLSPHPVS